MIDRKPIRAALRAFTERRKGDAITDAARLNPAKNPNLESDLTDLIADALIVAGDVGMDAAKVLRMALLHVPGPVMAKAHGAVVDATR